MDIHNGAGLTANTPVVYYLVVYVNDNDTVQNTEGDNYVIGSYNGSVTLQAMGGEVRANFAPETAAEYITRLYNEAPKSATPATVNGIDYNLAPSVGLMDDRLGGTTASLDGGNIRYYGANPNNYVWLGDTYSESYTVGSGDSAINVVAGTKKLWRIIGVFNGKLKLISADPISSTKLSWDTSDSSINSGLGINEWSQADLMKLLNPNFQNESVNNSLYWNKTSGTVYTRENNGITARVSFASTGLTVAERNLIDTETWYLGGTYYLTSYVNTQYAAERQSTTLGKSSCTQGTKYCNDTVTRTGTWNGMVGLMYPSDYGYAADLSQCGQQLFKYQNSGCGDTDWMNIGQLQWTISPCAYPDLARMVFVVLSSGRVDNGIASDAANGYVVRPAVYLKSGVTISGGNGSQSQPFELS